MRGKSKIRMEMELNIQVIIGEAGPISSWQGFEKCGKAKKLLT